MESTKQVIDLRDPFNGGFILTRVVEDGDLRYISVTVHRPNFGGITIARRCLDLDTGKVKPWDGAWREIP